MKRVFEVFLGVLTAFGGFVDMGDLVANAQTGARFGMGLAWVVVVGVIGIVVYAEMAGRVAAISGRPVFDVIRERLGARAALVNLGASFFINILTLTAEIAGLAVVIELATGGQLPPVDPLGCGGRVARDLEGAVLRVREGVRAHGSAAGRDPRGGVATPCRLERC